MASQPARARELAPSTLAALAKNVAVLAAWAGLALLLHRFIEQWVGGFYLKVILDIGIGIILAVSLNIVNGYTGQFSIGHAGFMIVGGYVAAAITYYGTALIWGDKSAHGGYLSCTSDISSFAGSWLAGGDLLFVVACLVGGLAAALAGYAVGLPSLRLRGDYLAIVTLGFGEIVRVLCQNTRRQISSIKEIQETSVPQLASHLGASLGLTRIPFYTTLFWVYFFVALTLLVAFRIKQSSYGRAMLSIREDEIAAEAMGVNTTKYKVRAFVIAAFFAGIAGALYSHLLGAINAGELGFMKSFDVVIMVVLGGMGSISGVVLAAAVLTILPELLRSPPHVWPAALLALLVVLAVRRRRGLKNAAWILGAAAGVELLRYLALRNGIDLSEYRMVIYALLLIIMMIVRPQGLFGVHEIWELTRRYRPGRCPKCNHNLTGNTSGVCPECGLVMSEKTLVSKA